jgi:hypothetical protein
VRHARGLRDLVNRDLVIVPVAEDLESRGEELLAALAGPLGCQGTRCDVVRLDRVDFESTLSSGCPTAESRW